MPIQCNITQPTGVVTTYHVVQTATMNLVENTGNVIVNSFLSKEAFDNGRAPVASNQIDISSFVRDNPITDASGQPIEAYLLMTSTFQSGVIV